MSNETQPLWKQLLGAVAGMSVALGAYGIWTAASPLMPEIEMPLFAAAQSSAPAALEKVGERARLLAADITLEPESVDASSSAQASSASKASAAASSVAAPAVMEVQVSRASQASSVRSSTAASSIAAAPVATSVESDLHAGAPSLPSSGVALWAIAFIALLLTSLRIQSVRTFLAEYIRA